MTFKEAYLQLLNALNSLYEAHEAQTISKWLIEEVGQFTALGYLEKKDAFLNPQQTALYHQYKQSLLQGQPLQYVLGKTQFCGHEFMVSPAVLIPRPETEELVNWIINDVKSIKDSPLKLLDIGTGSGCIAISLQKKLQQLEVSACDISEAALQIAQKNAQALNSSIHFHQWDILKLDTISNPHQWDIIVSNPPYIPIEEEASIAALVKHHEPSIALFTTEGAPLEFYDAIARFGLLHLKKTGTVYCEIHQDYAQECKALFEHYGYHQCTIQKDLFGNERMLKACF